MLLLATRQAKLFQATDFSDGLLAVRAPAFNESYDPHFHWSMSAVFGASQGPRWQFFVGHTVSSEFRISMRTKLVLVAYPVTLN